MADSKTNAKLDLKPVFFGKKEKKLLLDPLNDNNPITVQVLGICSALAVTTLTTKALTMAVAVTLVVGFSNLITSLLRKLIPSEVRMIAQLIIIATLVTVVSLTLQAVNYPMYKELSVFIGLIITNCIVMGRLEAFAMANDPWRSFLDGIGNGLGYGVILLIIAALRELLGKGAIFGFKLFGPGPDFLVDTQAISMLHWYTPNNLMVLFPSAMFVLAVIIWLHRTWNSKLVDVS